MTRGNVGVKTDPVEGGKLLAIVLNRDLMFGSRIRSALGMLGLEARFVPDTDAFLAAIRADGGSAAIGILDMNGAIVWDALSEGLDGVDNAPPTLGFGPHVDVENRRAAKAAGVTRIVSNGQFHAETAALIDRYRRR